MSDNEIVDILNEKHEVIRQSLKAEAHQNGWLHKTVIGYLRYGDDWALVRQAADRSEEEIGTRNITFKHIGNAVYHRQVIGRDENHLFIIYEITTNDKIHLNHEAVAIERFTPAELKNVIANEPERIGAAFYFNLNKFYPDYLPGNSIDERP